MKTVTLCLGFDRNAEEAVRTYVDLFNEVFGNSKIHSTTFYSQKEIDILRSIPEMTDDLIPCSTEEVKTIRFSLNGQEILAFNGGAYFGKFNESSSLYVTCETQEQIDRLWAKLSEGGEEQPCGWVKDRFGLSWQIVPSIVWEVMEGPDQEKVDRMNAVLYTMQKLDFAALKASIE